MCIFKAWDDTFRNWGVVTSYLEAYPKDHKVKIEDNAAALGDAIRLKRKPPHHANTEHELEVCILLSLNPSISITCNLLSFYIAITFLCQDDHLMYMC